MQAARIHQHGTPDVIVLDDVPAPAQDRHVVIDVAYAGINYVDAYQRTGRYPGIVLPLTLGIEAAGRVAYAPPDSGWRTGERVAFAATAQGAHAEQVAVPAEGLVRLPERVALREAAATLEHGLTAYMLFHRVARIAQGSHGWAIVHAGGGGVGRWLIHALLLHGVDVIALASTTAKRAALAQMGALPLDSTDPAWPDLAQERMGGLRAQWVFDSVGAATVDGSLSCLAECGHLIVYGAASGQVPPIDAARLMQRSATFSRPVLPHYLRNPQQLALGADWTFAALLARPALMDGATAFPLAEIHAAHHSLESRQRQGKLLLEVGGEP
ncbi:quinone oxidoreductase [Chitinimonas prasina]|uniref:Quinone oxidoreductase n=1 Tax=Chitinimonas prasina TaxID=1434937 RepID=A0ABQ5YGS6_9NEIS|nr:zinc-binding dehydrogenase [Chitinimonas prasina]GLR13781.1 quinone oxidoreductase [Chitinimonas prasina]